MMKAIVALLIALLLAGCATGRAEYQAHESFKWSRQTERVSEPVRRPSMPASIPLGGKVIVINLERQVFAAYEEGVIAVRSGHTIVGPISSGKRGWDTPVGMFNAQIYVEDHTSTKYPRSTRPGVPDGGGRMPHAVFFDGDVAIHGGDVSSPRQSHGCVRVSPRTAEFLWEEFYDVGDRSMRFVVVASMHDFNDVVASR